MYEKKLKLAQTANEEESPDSDEACCGLMDVTHESVSVAVQFRIHSFSTWRNGGHFR